MTPSRNRSGPGAPALRLEALEAREVPALFAIDDLYAVPQGDTLTVGAAGGVLANDFSNLDFGAVLQAALDGQPQILGSNRPLPANTVQLNPDGSFTIVAPSQILGDGINPLPQQTIQIVFDYTLTSVSNPNEVAVTGTVTVTLRPRDREFIAVAPQPGQEPLVRVYEVATGELVRTILAYERSFLGGVRVASEDFTGDGVDDIVTVPGLGGSARVRVFDGVGGDLIFEDVFLDPDFRGGGYVSVIQLVPNGAGRILLGAGEGGGPIVTLIGTNLDPFEPIIDVGDPNIGTADFFAYDPELRAGVRVAGGDFTGDGIGDIAVAPGPGGGPQVKVYSGVDVIDRVFNDLTPDEVSSFFGGDSADRNGVYITAADVDGGADEIVTGTGSGPAIVRIYGLGGALKGQFNVPAEATTSAIPALGSSDPTFPVNSTLFPSSGSLLAPAQSPGSLVGTGFTAGPDAVLPGVATGGVTVTSADFNADGIDEIVTGAGPGQPPRVRVFTAGGAQLNSFLALTGDVLSGVNVG